MSAASRFTDSFICGVDFVPGTIVGPCSPDVLIGDIPAARFGDLCLCASAHPSTITDGAPNVLINGKPAARIGAVTSHGGSVIAGDSDVLIGDE